MYITRALIGGKPCLDQTKTIDVNPGIPVPRFRSTAASCERSQSHDADILPKVDRLISHQTYTPVHEDQTSQNHIVDT